MSSIQIDSYRTSCRVYWVVIVVAIEQAMAGGSGTAKLVESGLCWLRCWSTCLGIARHAREIRYADYARVKEAIRSS